MWSSGDTFVVRTVAAGRVRWAMPHTLVDHADAVYAIYIEPGVRSKAPTTSIRTGTLSSFAEPWAHVDHLWRDNRFLRLTRAGDAHSLYVCWNASWDFLGWYVNLQRPLRETRLGYDTRDHALDVVVDPHGSWRWKDEDELALAVRKKIFSAADADELRRYGERVVAARPWPTGWEDWRPPQEWPLPELPDDWHVV